MSLHGMLLARAAEGNPLRIGVIGAGKFGSMYLSQIPTTPGHPSAGHRRSLAAAGTREPGAAGLEARGHRGRLARRGAPSRQHPSLPTTGARWSVIPRSTSSSNRRAIRSPPSSMRWKPSSNGKSVVMVTVEADAFCGPLLAKRAAEAGVIYSLAYGDQPALICELVDWARTSGLRGDGGGTRPQMAAALRAIDARDGVEILGPQRGAGQARRPEPQDVQLLPRRLQARHREHGGGQRHRSHAGAGRPRLSALLGRGPALRHAPGLRGRPPASQGSGRSARARSSATAAPSPTRSARACGSCSRRRPSTRRTASRSTCSAPTRRAATPSCTSAGI